MEIEGYETLYMIYDNGRIYSLISKKFLKHKYNKNYPYVSLYKDKIAKNKWIHRLVAEHYLPNPENKSQVDHIDRNPRNCHVSNLRWATQSENMKNIKKLAKNTSGVTGVYYHAKNKKWIAQLSCEGTVKYIGSYTTKEEASDIYSAYANMVYGEYDNPNR